MPSYTERVRERRASLEAALARFVATARAFPDVRAVYTFGSVATGAVGPRSDLDLLVVRETAVRGIERGTDLAIAAQLDVEYDLIVVTPDEFENRLPHTSFGRTIRATMRRADAA